MTSRERNLVGAVAAAGVLWFGSQGLGRYRAAVEQSTNKQIEAEQALSEAHAARNRGFHARRQLNKWISGSLPTNREIAESLYQDWLRAQLTGAGLQVTQLTDRSGNRRNPQFEELTFEVRASGSLAQLVDFLYRFYSAPHLHRIAAATIVPAEAGRKLDAIMTISGLILPGSSRTDKLAEAEPQSLASTLADLQKRVLDRNIFAPSNAGGGESGGRQEGDAAAKSMLTGLDYGLYGWRVSVRNTDSGEIRAFQQGDVVEIGRFKGSIVEIDHRRVIIETDNGPVEVRIGQSLGDAVALQAPAA